MRRIWVLGAPDPEMEAIEGLLRQCGEEIIYATDATGQRVHPGNAYRCPVPEVPEDATVYAVECIDKLPEGWIRIDHHRSGDPGCGKPPEEFMSASSIGQVIAELAKTGALRRAIQHEITHWMTSHRDLPVLEYNKMLRTNWFWTRQNMPGPDPYPSDGTIARGVSWIYDGYAVAVHRNDFYFEHRVALIPLPIIYAAASDHCLAAAYRGECPGVDPGELMHWRIETRAAFQGRPVEDVLADVERAREALREAPTTEIGGGAARDLRDRVVPELIEAAAREGVAYLATVIDRGGRRKVVLGGHATPETLQAFMTEWAPARGFVDIYGDPARGFAGGYLSHVEEATP